MSKFLYQARMYRLSKIHYTTLLFLISYIISIILCIAGFLFFYSNILILKNLFLIFQYCAKKEGRKPFFYKNS